MPLESWPNPNLPVPDDEAVIWRYFKLIRFADLMRSSELHFCRCDLFNDENEGLPTDAYIRWVCEHQAIGGFDHVKGVLKQDTEASFASCWHNFDETAKMWVAYGRGGVAVVSRFGRLKEVLRGLSDRVMVGPINYSEKYFHFNVLRFITTKRLNFAWEREIRALIWVPEWAGQGRNLDEQNNSYPKPLTPPPPHVLPGLRRHVDLPRLVERIVISPEADDVRMEEVKALVSAAGLTVPVEKSGLCGYSRLITNLDDILKYTE
jgi:hypothetical protein